AVVMLSAVFGPHESPKRPPGANLVMTFFLAIASNVLFFLVMLLFGSVHLLVGRFRPSLRVSLGSDALRLRIVPMARHYRALHRGSARDSAVRAISTCCISVKSPLILPHWLA